MVDIVGVVVPIADHFRRVSCLAIGDCRYEDSFVVGIESDPVVAVHLDTGLGLVVDSGVADWEAVEWVGATYTHGSIAVIVVLH